MRLLVDAHSLIWYVTDDSRLSSTASRAISDVDNQGIVSVATLWELAIKIRLGKLQLGVPFHELVRERLARDGFTILPISGEHLISVASLPMHHRDPFDRLLVAQALVESIPIVSVDSALDAYGIERIW